MDPYMFLALCSREEVDAFLLPYAPRVRAMWLAGASEDAIAKAIPMHVTFTAACLSRMSDADLLTGLRLHFRTLAGS
jgi:hypothetical protein